MKILEIIHVQSAGRPMAPLSDQVGASLRVADERSGIVTIYRRHGLVNDLAIHIQHAGRSGAAEPTELGLRLAAALREHGLVEHTLWQEL